MNHIVNSLIAINTGYSHKMIKISLNNFNKHSIQLLNILSREKLISHYTIINEKKLNIFLLYSFNGIPALIENHIMYTRKLAYISYNELINQNYRYILFTSYGIISSSEARNLKIGGKPIFRY